jgi:DNA-binding transcriptional regulator YhcF (GntR family)
METQIYRNIPVELHNQLLKTDFTSIQRQIWLDIYIDSDIYTYKKILSVKDLAAKHGCHERTIRVALAKFALGKLLKRQGNTIQATIPEEIQKEIKSTKSRKITKANKTEIIIDAQGLKLRACTNQHGQVIFLPVDEISLEEVQEQARKQPSNQQSRAVGLRKKTKTTNRPPVDNLLKQSLKGVQEVIVGSEKTDPTILIPYINKTKIKTTLPAAEKTQEQTSGVGEDRHRYFANAKFKIPIPKSLRKKVEQEVKILKEQGKASTPKILVEELVFAIEKCFAGQPKDKKEITNFDISRYNTFAALKILKRGTWSTPKGFVKPSHITDELSSAEIRRQTEAYEAEKKRYLEKARARNSSGKIFGVNTSVEYF